MPNQVHYDSENVDAITIKFYAVASNPLLMDPCNGFGIIYQYQYEKGYTLHLLYGEIEKYNY